MSKRYRSQTSAILRSQGRTNAWFWRKMGVSKALFYAVESGRRPATAEYRKRAAEVLGLPEDVLFLPTVLTQDSETLSIESKPEAA